MAAVTSSNGHGSKFIVSQPVKTGVGAGKIEITQSVGGVKGNTTITYNNKITSSLSSRDSSFSGGIDLENQVTTFDNELITVEGSVEFPISGTNEQIARYNTDSFVNLHNLWGTSSNDVHFLNMATQDHQTGSDAGGEYNVNHIEPRYHFYMIGDLEIYSGSNTSANQTEFTNFRRFYNRQNISEYTHKNTTYESYINGNPGPQKGRMIGKTKYFITSEVLVAGGQTKPSSSRVYPAISKSLITLPSNHVKNYSNPWTDRMYQGTQNIDPVFMNPDGDEDYATASFYRVKVTGGENQLIVRSGKILRDNNTKKLK